MNVLFRGETTLKGEWVEGDLRHRGDKTLIYSEVYDVYSQSYEPCSYEVIPETVEINLFGKWIKLTDLDKYRVELK